MSKKCKVDGCNNKHLAKGYCEKHYAQVRRHGHILDDNKKNEIIEHDDYAEIVLYNKQGKEVARAIIDLEYIDSIKNYKWYLAQDGYVCNPKIGRLHRYIMNPSDKLVVDHINHNPLDNRRENLRVCTIQQNSMNRSVNYNNKSGTTGVHWSNRYNRWIARIKIDGKIKYLGSYKSKEEAIEARRQAEIEYFGEFAPDNED